MNQQPKMLVSSDNLSTGLLWEYRTKAKSITIIMEPNFLSIAERIELINPDIVLLDLEHVNAIDIQMIRKLREEQACPLIVMLTGWDADSTMTVYDAGADDCIIKPIEVDLLIAKINAWLRRRMVMPVEMLNPLRVGKFYLDTPAKILNINGGTAIHLTNIEARLLYVLMSRMARPVLIDELSHLVWRNGEDVCRTILKTTIYRLRQKLESESVQWPCIQTVPGGYRFEPDPERETNVKALSKLGTASLKAPAGAVMR